MATLVTVQGRARSAMASKGRLTNLAVIAVDEEWVVLLVKYEAKDLLHRLDGNFLLLRSLHIKDVMFDAVLRDECLIALGELLLDKGAVRRQHVQDCRRKQQAASSSDTDPAHSHLHNRLQT